MTRKANSPRRPYLLYGSSISCRYPDDLERIAVALAHSDESPPRNDSGSVSAIGWDDDMCRRNYGFCFVFTNVGHENGSPHQWWDLLLEPESAECWTEDRAYRRRYSWSLRFRFVTGSALLGPAPHLPADRRSISLAHLRRTL